MRPALIAFLSLAFLVPATSQTKEKSPPSLAVRTAPQYIIRINLLHYFTSRFDKTCVIVYPDDSIHFERYEQTVRQDSPKVKVISETKLTPQQVERLNALLRDPDVSSAEGDMGSAGIIPFHGESRSIEAEIPRGVQRTQYVTGASVDGRKPDSAIVSLISFMDAIESSDLPTTKHAKVNLCRAPKPKFVGK